MPDFISGVRNIWRRLTGNQGVAPTGSAEVRKTIFQDTFSWAVPLKSRKDEEDIITRMDGEDGIVGSALDAIADCATTFPEQGMDDDIVVTSASPETQKVLDDMIHRTGLVNQLWDITRTTVKKGNHFAEVRIGQNGKIDKVKQLPYSYQIYKNTDDFGDLKTGDPEVCKAKNILGEAPYDQIIDNELRNCFYASQIVHFMFGATEGASYAQAMLSKERRNWLRLQTAEDSVAMARLFRAWDTHVHHVPIPIGATKEEQAEYLDRYKKSIERKTTASWDSTNSVANYGSNPEPIDVEASVYLPRFYTPQGQVVDGDLMALSGSNPNITNIDDLEHFLNRILCVLKVPAKYLNYSTTKSTFIDSGTSQQDEQFGRTLRRVQKAMKIGLYQLMDMELILNGIDPTSTDYSIVMPPIAIRVEEREANIAMQRANTASIWRNQLAVPLDIVYKDVLNMSPDTINTIATRPEEPTVPKPGE